MKRAYCQRKFGKTQITIDKQGHIAIIGDWFSNHGIIYDFNIQPFKDGVKSPITGDHIQIIGMDTEVSKIHSNWIYSKIKKGYFDHLYDEYLFMK